MLTLRPAKERGRTNFGWLNSFHTFSFGGYRDPQHVQYRTLRVLNDDVIAPGMGFDTHPHRDMEIISVVLDGAMAHKDSTGGGGVIRPGDVQRMSAGSGVEHSEFNASKTEPLHLLQIWILPERKGIEPSYEQKHFPLDERLNTLKLIASRDARGGSLRIVQDADVYVGTLEPGAGVTHAVESGRGVWVHVGTGSVQVNGETLNAGDGAAIEDVSSIEIRGVERAEVLLFDMA